MSRISTVSCGVADIHIGRYDSGEETAAKASAAMTRYLLDLAGLGQSDAVLDNACGYGGTLRLLAERGCRHKGIDIASACVDEFHPELAPSLAGVAGCRQGGVG